MATDKHDLLVFLEQLGHDLASEYNRIYARASEDPGTAGDQGEENWAELLKSWLPGDYQIVTKGRIINERGLVSPQIDILVLDKNYPRGLLTKKLYLAAGVVAAIECKTTLTAKHVSSSVERCVKFKSLYAPNFGTPYSELHSPLLYGVLAHSHSWKRSASKPDEIIERELHDADGKFVDHPRNQLDFICVSDLGTWSSSKMTFFGPPFNTWSQSMANMYGPNGSAASYYVGNSKNTPNQAASFSPIGALLSCMVEKLAWKDTSLRSYADYFRLLNTAGAGRGQGRRWDTSIYSGQVKARVERGGLANGVHWDEWSMMFT
jgi:hypothetical protein